MMLIVYVLNILAKQNYIQLCTRNEYHVVPAIKMGFFFVFFLICCEGWLFVLLIWLNGSISAFTLSFHEPFCKQ